MANLKSAPARPVIQYHKFNIREELQRAKSAECSSCDVCDHGRLLYIAASDLLDLMKASEQKERRTRRAFRRGNLILFPKAV